MRLHIGEVFFPIMIPSLLAFLPLQPRDCLITVLQSARLFPPSLALIQIHHNMRLINVANKVCETFVEDDAPPYAILSHTWGSDNEEITFQQLSGNLPATGLGRIKLDGCCAQAAHDGIEYVWIDTCCIDKTSAVELSEAINSMFRWYQNSTICYVYLSDVTRSDDPFEPQSEFRRSRWFTRGWTLQELIAPKTLRFYKSDWDLLGSKRTLASALVEITSIPKSFLLGFSWLSEASVAQRMSWAANRVTKRKEDLAYCLLGIFGLTMTMIYGERDRAFVRLQEEITKHIRDDSILAWNFNPQAAGHHPEFDSLPDGVLASSPADFINCGNIMTSWSEGIVENSFQISGGTLQFQGQVYSDHMKQRYIVLNCHSDSERPCVVGVQIRESNESHGYFTRLRGSVATLLPTRSTKTTRETIHILINRPDPPDSRRNYGILIENTLENHLQIIDAYPLSSWDKRTDILIPEADPNESQPLQRLWTRLRHRSQDGYDFVAAFEVIRQPPNSVRAHLMICSRDTSLEKVQANFNRVESQYLGFSGANNGTLKLQVTLSRQRIGRQKMSVAKFIGVETVSETLDMSQQLEVIRIENDFVSTIQLHAKGQLRDQNAPEDYQSDLQSTREDIGNLDEKIFRLLQKRQALERREQLLKFKIDVYHDNIESTDLSSSSVSNLLAQGSGPGGKIARLDWEAEASILGLSSWKAIDNMDCSSERFLLTLASKGDERLFKFFNRPYFDLRISDFEGDNLLTWAARSGNARMVRSLLKMGISANYRNFAGFGALHGASQRGHDHIIKVLLDAGAAVNMRDKNGLTPLWWALAPEQNQVRPLESAKILLEHGADIDETISENPVLVWQTTEIAQLLQSCGLVVSSKHLIAATKLGNLDLVRVVVKADAFQPEWTKEARDEALQGPVYPGRAEIYDFLFNFNALRRMEQVTERDNALELI